MAFKPSVLEFVVSEYKKVCDEGSNETPWPLGDRFSIFDMSEVTSPGLDKHESAELSLAIRSILNVQCSLVRIFY